MLFPECTYYEGSRNQAVPALYMPENLSKQPPPVLYISKNSSKQAPRRKPRLVLPVLHQGFVDRNSRINDEPQGSEDFAAPHYFHRRAHVDAGDTTIVENRVETNQAVESVLEKSPTELFLLECKNFFRLATTHQKSSPQELQTLDSYGHILNVAFQLKRRGVTFHRVKEGKKIVIALAFDEGFEIAAEEHDRLFKNIRLVYTTLAGMLSKERFIRRERWERRRKTRLYRQRTFVLEQDESDNSNVNTVPEYPSIADFFEIIKKHDFPHDVIYSWHDQACDESNLTPDEVVEVLKIIGWVLACHNYDIVVSFFEYLQWDYTQFLKDPLCFESRWYNEGVTFSAITTIDTDFIRYKTLNDDEKLSESAHLRRFLRSYSNDMDSL